MNTLLITYELKGNQDYSGLFKTLESASRWWHYLDSTWLVKTDQSPIEWNEKLKPQIDLNTDSILIIEIAPNARNNGWLPQKAWDWINTNIKKQT